MQNSETKPANPANRPEVIESDDLPTTLTDIQRRGGGVDPETCACHNAVALEYFLASTEIANPF